MKQFESWWERAPGTSTQPRARKRSMGRAARVTLVLGSLAVMLAGTAGSASAAAKPKPAKAAAQYVDYWE